MTKITIITGIIAAVCVFQTVEGLLTKPVLPAIPGLNQVKDILKNNNEGLLTKPVLPAIPGLNQVKDILKNNNGGNVLTDALNNFQKPLDLVKCLPNLISNGLEFVTGFFEKFKSCVLETNVKQMYKNIMNATQNLINPKNLFSCITNKNCNIGPLLSEVVDAASNLIGVFPKVVTCTSNASSSDLKKIAELGKQCLGNVFPFKL